MALLLSDKGGSATRLSVTDAYRKGLDRGCRI